MDLDKIKARYMAALHAMQSGVAASASAGIGNKECSPKHLRVGVNSAMIEHSALASLLMKKGIVSEEEYFEAITIGIEEEVVRYEKTLTNYYGKVIKLA